MKESGTTLVECLVTLALGLLFIQFLMQIYLHTKDLYLLQQSLFRIQENGLLASEVLRKKIQYAKSIQIEGKNQIKTDSLEFFIRDKGLYIKQNGHSDEIAHGIEKMEVTDLEDAIHIKLTVEDHLIQKNFEFTVVLFNA